MTTQPKFAVIIPARNAAATIGRCLDSINALEIKPAEIIVIDDGSTDQTGAIAASKGALVITHRGNTGPGLARNSGAAAATSEYLAFTDSDCEVPRNWLNYFRDALRDDRYVAVTGPYAGATDSKLLSRLIDLTLRYSQRDLPDEIEAAISSNLCVRKRDFDLTGGFPAYRLPLAAKCYFGNEDEEFGYLLCVKSGQRIRWIRENGVYHGYRATLGKFFRQQFKYAEAILVSYFRFPGMMRASSNYSRSGGASKVLTVCLALAGLLFSPMTVYALLGLIPFLLVNYGGVRYVAGSLDSESRWLNSLRSYGLFFLMALAWTAGLICGAAKGIAGFVYWKSIAKGDAVRTQA